MEELLRKIGALISEYEQDHFGTLACGIKDVNNNLPENWADEYCWDGEKFTLCKSEMY
jgi:hypothetical protein